MFVENQKRRSGWSYPGSVDSELLSATVSRFSQSDLLPDLGPIALRKVGRKSTQSAGTPPRRAVEQRELMSDFKTHTRRGAGTVWSERNTVSEANPALSRVRKNSSHQDTSQSLHQRRTTPGRQVEASGPNDAADTHDSLAGAQASKRSLSPKDHVSFRPDTV